RHSGSELLPARRLAALKKLDGPEDGFRRLLADLMEDRGTQGGEQKIIDRGAVPAVFHLHPHRVADGAELATAEHRQPQLFDRLRDGPELRDALPIIPDRFVGGLPGHGRRLASPFAAHRFRHPFPRPAHTPLPPPTSAPAPPPTPPRTPG